jgi:hypothetical protein
VPDTTTPALDVTTTGPATLPSLPSASAACTTTFQEDAPRSEISLSAPEATCTRTGGAAPCSVGSVRIYRLSGDLPGARPRIDNPAGCWLPREVRRLGPVLVLLAAFVAAVPAVASAAQIAQRGEAIGGPANPKHANLFTRDGLPSVCGDSQMGPSSPILTTDQVEYKKHTFRSNVQEPMCVTVTLSTSCTGNNEVMSESYSPTYDPNSITANWIADLGNSPPAATSYSFNVAPGTQFETVIDERSPTGACTFVSTTWTSERPWAFGRPFVDGVPAVGQTLTDNQDIWAENPSVQRQWLRCDSAGANCADIPGATASTYTPTDADLGHALSVRETATDGGGTSTSLGRATAPVFIPFEAHLDQSLGPGDASQQGSLSPSGFVASSCAAPKSPPPLANNDLHLNDSYAVTSLVNEPQCIRVAKPELECFSTSLAVYSPTFNPTAITENYVADDARSAALSYTLPPGATAVHVITETSFSNSCSPYDLVIGADGPFARSRPAISGAATEGSALATSDGDWSGRPSFAYEWWRCDAQGDGCSPIAGAGAATYTPTADDVGHRLRVRVTATQGGSASVDSEPSAVIASAPPGSGSADRRPPDVKLALARTTLQKVVKRGFIPVNVTCDEACTIRLRANVTRKLARRLGGVKIASGKGAGPAGRRVTVKVKLTRKARKALRRRKSVSFTLKATATDAAGNSGAVTRKAKLKRRR